MNATVEQLVAFAVHGDSSEMANYSPMLMRKLYRQEIVGRADCGSFPRMLIDWTIHKESLFLLRAKDI